MQPGVTLLANYITGIHRYSFRSGEPGELIETQVMSMEDENGSGGFLRTVFKVRYNDGFTDYVPMESVLSGHYILTPFKPTPEEIENFRTKGDAVSSYDYAQFICNRNSK